MKKLSIIIPVFNEENTVGKTLSKVYGQKLPEGVQKELVIVNDGSTDTTLSNIKKIVASWSKSSYQIISYHPNKGKGLAVRQGIHNATGDYLIIQDADLEYDPVFIPKLMAPVFSKKADVVYGTRLRRFPHLTREERTLQFLIHFFGNRFLSLVTSILYGQWITDMETGYKLFPKKAINTVELRSKGFEFEPEITALLIRGGYTIKEVSITTNPRSYDEGKKLNTVRDGIKAFVTLIQCRFFS